MTINCIAPRKITHSLVVDLFLPGILRHAPQVRAVGGQGGGGGARRGVVAVQETLAGDLTVLVFLEDDGPQAEPGGRLPDVRWIDTDVIPHTYRASSST